MIPISNRIYNVVTESLNLRYKNLDLIESYQEADRENQRASDALLEVMQKNRDKEQALEKSETFLRTLFTTANDGIITADSNGIIQSANHAIERDFGYTAEEMVGKSINMIMDDEVGQRHDRYMAQYLNSDMPVLAGRMLDVMGRRKDGSLFPMEITVSETRIDDKRYFTGFIRDISERKSYENALHEMMKKLAEAKHELEETNSQLAIRNKALTELSQHDALTGLVNRRFMLSAFQREWARLQRTHKPISVILLDIDYFKRFNDNYGHQAGDSCLKEVAETLSKIISRPADFIARYGGEEFIVVLPETEHDGAYHIAEQMRQAIARLDIKHSCSEIAKHVTISCGVSAIIPDKHNNYERLIAYADKALYTAKQSGRNCTRQYTGSPDAAF